jgi:chromosome segregation ATPase
MLIKQSNNFEKIIERHKAELSRLKTILAEQKNSLEQLKADYEKLGIDRSKLPPLESLPREYQERYLAFERDLRDLDSEINAAPKKIKTPGRRRNIV